MTCATAWLQAVVQAAEAARRYVVVDEAWALLSSLGTARWLQQSYELARSGVEVAGCTYGDLATSYVLLLEALEGWSCR